MASAQGAFARLLKRPKAQQRDHGADRPGHADDNPSTGEEATWPKNTCESFGDRPKGHLGKLRAGKAEPSARKGPQGPHSPAGAPRIPAHEERGWRGRHVPGVNPTSGFCEGVAALNVELCSCEWEI